MVELHTGSAVRSWLLDHVCPYWASRIVGSDGGFFESLDAQGHPVFSQTRKVLSQARLTYVFSHAAVLGADSKMREAADHGFDWLRRASTPSIATLDDGARGPNGSLRAWHRSTSSRDEIIDPTRDTYDQAFVIFAMAWYHRASGSAQALDLAEQCYRFLETHVADRVHGGFFEEFPQSGKLPRRQNPHMHLLEATLAMHQATGNSVWIERASSLVALFTDIFIDQGTGALAEYFDMAWNRAEGVPGTLREPGHQFEWVWLLGQFMRQSGRRDLEGHAQRLFAFGTQHGLDKSGPLTGVAFDVLDNHGRVVADTKLVWPQTEYIKACIARFEATGDGSYRQQAFAHLNRLRQHFFFEDGANWVNHVTRNGEPLVRQTPARVLYHVFLACAELIRLEECNA